MKQAKLLLPFLLLLLAWAAPGRAQTLPGQAIVYGPMLSPIYHDSIRVWLLTKDVAGSTATLSLELKTGTAAPLTGLVHDSDTRQGYYLRSFTYSSLAAGQRYTATVKKDGVSTGRTATTTNANTQVSDFSFLAGGCGRIMDLTRCVDQIEGASHVNGTTDIFKRMAGERSDLMVWLGDAVYLFGIEHSQNMCPGMVNDWDNRDALFSRFNFNRQYHDSLLRAMPQLAITDNHDTGGNEFNKTMATLPISRDNFMKWWPNPNYKSTSEGQGLFSTYRYKDVEFFLLDNRSYRGSTIQHLGPEQLAWLKRALRASTAPFKVLVSGTPAFGKHHGGRNFAITAECDDLLAYVKAQNIDGLLCYSADIHQQEFYGRYNDHTYPFFDIVSGNLASDIGTSGTAITPDNDIVFASNMQTYMRTSVYGQVGDRRYKIEYVSPNGVVYYSAIIHEDMLKSLDNSTRKLSLSFAGSLRDSSTYNRTLQASGVSYGPDRAGTAASALTFTATSTLSMAHTPELDMHDRTFSLAYWVKPAQLPASSYAAVFSNSSGADGYTVGLDNAGHSVFVNHATGQTYTSFLRVSTGAWSHFVWKYDNIRLQLFLYYNGRLAQKWANVTAPVASAGGLRIGSNAAGHHFVGSLDEFNTFGKLISDPKIAQLSGYAPQRGAALRLTGTHTTTLPTAQFSPAVTGGFTVECWARVTADPATSAKLLASNGRINNNTTGFSLEFSAANKLNVALGNNTANWTLISEAGNPWQIGEWNHVALTAVPNDSIRLYINGNKVGKAPFTSYAANTFGLGLGYSTAYNSPIQGEMDELRIWNAAQPQDSIRKRLHYTMTGTEPGLAYYYNFSTGTTATTVSSLGANTFALPLSGAGLLASTAPVVPLLPAYRRAVAGNWSLRRAAIGGLNLDEPITDFAKNLVIGYNAGTATAPLSAGSPVQYLTGGWQLDALNIPLGTLTVDLSQRLPNFATVVQQASEYYLLKANATGTPEVVNTGYFDGRNLKFLNTFLEGGVYFLGWKADAAALFSRGKALSLPGGHQVRLPRATVNAALAGSFTIEFWSRLMQLANGSLLSNHGRVNNNTTGLTMEIPNGGALSVTFGTNLSTGWNSLHANTWNVGEWNHVAVTGTPNGYLRLYLNGVLADSSAFTGYVPNTTDLALGASQSYNNETVSLLDEFRIWSRAKSRAEIRNQMHLPITAATSALAYNFTFNQPRAAYLLNTGAGQDSVASSTGRLVPSTAPVGNISAAQQHRVTGSWSISATPNTGLAVLAPMADYDTNLVLGKDSLSGRVATPALVNTQNLRTRWQLDPLKLGTGELEFDGLALLGTAWPTIKTQAIEYYLLQQNAAGQLVVRAVGTESSDKVLFTGINLAYGTYTLGWKSIVSGVVDMASQHFQFFPNPTTDYLTLAGLTPREVAQVAVLTSTGQRVAIQSQFEANELKLNVRSLAAGAYVVLLTKKNGEKVSTKFVKE